MKKMCFVRFLSVVLIALFFVSCDNVIPADSDSVTGSSVEESVTGENQASTDKESEKDSAETESCSHDFREVPEKAPSCLEDGYTAHEVCALCEEKVGYSVRHRSRKACDRDGIGAYRISRMLTLSRKAGVC